MGCTWCFVVRLQLQACWSPRLKSCPLEILGWRWMGTGPVLLWEWVWSLCLVVENHWGQLLNYLHLIINNIDNTFCVCVCVHACMCHVHNTDTRTWWWRRWLLFGVHLLHPPLYWPYLILHLPLCTLKNHYTVTLIWKMYNSQKDCPVCALLESFVMT